MKELCATMICLFYAVALFVITYYIQEELYIFAMLNLGILAFMSLDLEDYRRSNNCDDKEQNKIISKEIEAYIASFLF